MKDARLEIRLSREERKRLSELIKESNTKTASGYVRACINEKKLPNIDMEELIAVKYQLSKLGNNFNQMDYLARTEGICDTTELERLLKDIDEQVQKIYKLI